LPKFEEIREHKKVLAYLNLRDLCKKYQKQKHFLLEGKLQSVDFKKRKPYSKDIYYFRVDKKFRAYCYFDKKILRVFKIDDHQ